MSALVRSAKRIGHFALKHKWWGAGIVGAGILLYVVRPSSKFLWWSASAAGAGALLYYVAPRSRTKVLNFVKRHKKLTWGVGIVGTGGLLYAAAQSAESKKTSNVALAPAAVASFRGPQGLKAAIDRLVPLLAGMASGTSIPVFGGVATGAGFVSAEEVFRKIYTHQGSKVIDLVLNLYYGSGHFSTDELSNQSHCQTWAAQVVGLGNDWMAPFYNTVYRHPSSNPIYAGVPIDPQSDPGGFESARLQAVEAAISHALGAADFGGASDALVKILGAGAKLFGLDPKRPPTGSLYLFSVTDAQRNQLAQLARDMGAKAKPPITLPTTDGNGNPIPEPKLSQIHAAVGLTIIAHTIDMFESHDSKINPCIREVDAGLVISMIMIVVSYMLAAASLGSAGLLGPIFQAINFAYSMESQVQKLVALSK